MYSAASSPLPDSSSPFPCASRWIIATRSQQRCNTEPAALQPFFVGTRERSSRLCLAVPCAVVACPSLRKRRWGGKDGVLGGGRQTGNLTTPWGPHLTHSHLASGYSSVAGVRVTGQAVVVLDKCRVAHNSRGLMVSDEARSLVRKSRFLSNWHSSLSHFPFGMQSKHAASWALLLPPSCVYCGR
jgi:hypothetical protein